MKISENEIRKFARLAALKKIKRSLLKEATPAVNVPDVPPVDDITAKPVSILDDPKGTRDPFSSILPDGTDTGLPNLKLTEKDLEVDVDGDGVVEDDVSGSDNQKEADGKKPQAYASQEIKDKHISEMKSIVNAFDPKKNPVVTITKQKARKLAGDLYVAMVSAGESYVRVIGIGLGTDKDTIKSIFENSDYSCADISLIADEFQKKYGAQWNATYSLAATLSQELNDSDFYDVVEAPLIDKMENKSNGGYVRWGGKKYNKQEFFDMLGDATNAMRSVEVAIPSDEGSTFGMWAAIDQFGGAPDYQMKGAAYVEDPEVKDAIAPKISDSLSAKITPGANVKRADIGDLERSGTISAMAGGALAQQAAAAGIDMYEPGFASKMAKLAKDVPGAVDDKVIDFATGKPVQTVGTKGSRLAKGYGVVRTGVTKLPGAGLARSGSGLAARAFGKQIGSRLGLGPVGIALLANDIVQWGTSANITGEVDQVLSEELWSQLQKAHDQIHKRAKERLAAIEKIPVAEMPEEKPEEEKEETKEMKTLADLGIGTKLAVDPYVACEDIQSIMNTYTAQKSTAFAAMKAAGPYSESDENTGPKEFMIEEDGDWGSETERLWRVFVKHVFKNHPVLKKSQTASMVAQNGLHEWSTISRSLINTYPGYTGGIRGQLAFCIDAFSGNVEMGSQSHGSDVKYQRRLRKDRVPSIDAPPAVTDSSVDNEKEIVRSMEKAGTYETAASNYNTEDNVTVAFEATQRISVKIKGKDKPKEYQQFRFVNEFNPTLTKAIASGLINAMKDDLFFQGYPGNEIRTNRETYNLKVDLKGYIDSGEEETRTDPKNPNKTKTVTKKYRDVKVSVRSGKFGNGRYEDPERVVRDAIMRTASEADKEALSKATLVITFPYGVYYTSDEVKNINEAKNLAQRLIKRAILRKLLR